LVAPFTGSDIADLHQACDDHDICWTTIDWLPVPFVVDVPTRTVYVSGMLPLQLYYESITHGVYEIVHGTNATNVIPLRPGMGEHTGTG
jgi:hypothetical protein